MREGGLGREGRQGRKRMGRKQTGRHADRQIDKQGEGGKRLGVFICKS